MPVPLAALLLLPLCAARSSSDVGSIDGDRGPASEERISLGLRGAASFLAGSQGSAYRPGPAVGLLLDVAFSEYAGFTMDLDGALHRLHDPGALFDEDSLALPLDEGTITGSQRYAHLDLGLRFDLGSPDPYRREGVRASPWFRLAGGVSLSDTLLHVPTLSGRDTLRSRRLHGALCPAFGVRIAFPHLVTLQPAFKSVTIFGLDHDEVANTDALRALFRLQPSLDLLFRF